MGWVELEGGERLAVGKLICLARNYVEHAKEMGGEVPPKPVFFLKPSTAIIHDEQTILLPPHSLEVHAEAELAVVMGLTGRNIPTNDALDHVLGYAAFQDVTARDLQTAARKEGNPWTVSKGFDTFAPISTVARRDRVRDPQALDVTLTINGRLRQRVHTGAMVFPVRRLIADISEVMTLERGDIIATGTPAGVTALHPGDLLVTEVVGVARLTNRVALDITPRV